MSTMRTAKRQVAKARMAALGVDRINRRMGKKKDPTDRKEDPVWRRVLTGDLAKDAEKAQVGGKKRQRDSSGRRATRMIRRAREKA